VIAIETNSLFFSYNGRDFVLKDINLKIAKGETIAIMGENGAGKTTLVKHFNGLLKPTKGEVKVLGKNTKNESVASLSRHVGMIFQNPDHQLFGETIEKEVEFALRNFGFKEEIIERRVKWALELMELSEYRDKSPYTLSVGERKRLTIASVLAYDPDIVIMDEPTAGQDAIQKEKISEIISLLRHKGKTVIIVTHDVEFVVNRIDRVLLMADGHIIAEGDKRDVLTNLELLEKVRLLPPQIPHIAWLLKEEGLLNEHRVLYIDELIKVISSWKMS